MIQPKLSRPTSVHSIEPLESRIAPALLVHGANLLGGDSPSTGETSVGENSVQLVKVTAGRAIVWFDGFNITSISAGPGLRIELTGDIGDIVANLNADGTLTDSDNDPANGEDGGVLLASDIVGIKTRPLSGEKGSVGRIITGGAVSNVDISGTLNGLYAGDGAFRVESDIVTGNIVTSSVDDGALVPIDINPFAPGVQDEFNFAKANAQFKAGASITNVKVDRGDNLQVFAGNGSPSGVAVAGTGVAGGSITNFTISLASVLAGSPVGTPSYHLIAGDGANGKVGGAGGSINTVIETTSSGAVTMRAGNGGTGNGGAGGGGGNVLNLDVQSASSQYDVRSGDGGAGTPGGAGGKIVGGNFTNRTPIAGVLVTADFTGDGLDDVLVADSGTALMVVNENLAGGAGFSSIVQDGVSATIPGAGVNPVDGLAADVNGDGKQDAVILYRDGTMAAFINQGNGIFYDGGASDFAVQSISLGFTPAKFAEVFPGGGVYSVVENKDGKGTLYGVQLQVSGTDLVAEIFVNPIKYNRPIADVAGSFVGLSDGAIQELQISFSQTENTLIPVQDIAPVASGGLDDLDLSADRTRLLALSSAGRALTIYDVSDTVALALPVVSLSSLTGKALQAKFLNDNDSLIDDDIVVLSNSVDEAQFTLVNGAPATAPVYALGSHFETDTLLKNFAFVYETGAQSSIAALAGPLNQFTEVTNFVSEQQFSLPFASKQVTLTSGKGGNGLDVGTKLGKGGAGGAITNINIDAQRITLGTGVGGDSVNGAAGAGGSVSNAIPAVKGPNGETTPGTFKTAGGALVVPKLVAEASIEINVGNGGSPTGAGKSASGGAGGGMLALDITLTEGEVQLTSGSGGVGKGAAAGAGGDIAKVSVKALQGGLTVTTGNGGNATGPAGNGGAGGTISSLRYTLTLDEDAEKAEDPFAVTLTAGNGGVSTGGIGGAGGAINGVTLKLDGADRTFDDPLADPPLVDTHRDSTVTVRATAGDAGDGMKGGGAGGGIQGFSSETFHDQLYKNTVVVNYVVMGLFAGDGGNATAGNGGVGGAVTFSRPISGVTEFDPDMVGYDASVPALIVVGGEGGDGSLAGGAGGGVVNLTAQNSMFRDASNIARTSLYSAVVIGGDGGQGNTGVGGAGGAVQNALLGVNSGFMAVIGGVGGGSVNGKGGAGGGVLGSEFGLVVSEFALGMSVLGGGGGAGKTAGGAGGNLSGLRINTPQSTLNLSAFLIAGSGGAAASASGLGGKGGDVMNVSQAKDYNSSINLVQAGNGGANPLGKGGAGGNVNNFRTVGFIGRPSDNVGNQLGVFDNGQVQGLYSGRGGDGATDGVNGSISNIVARQIAAMAAAVDPLSGLFAAATKISNVKSALIGFDADKDGLFDTTGAPGATPSATRPVDGFILATAISQVTGTRAAFTFNA